VFKKIIGKLKFGSAKPEVSDDVNVFKKYKKRKRIN